MLPWNKLEGTLGMHVIACIDTAVQQQNISPMDASLLSYRGRSADILSRLVSNDSINM